MFRLFDLIDDHNREVLGIEADFSLPSLLGIRVLDLSIQWRGVPNMILCDSAPGDISASIMQWAKRRGIELSYIQPGKP